MSPGPLPERNAELARIASLIARVSTAAGGALLLEGPAGIGKSRLLEAGVAEAGDEGVAVLSARGTRRRPRVGRAGRSFRRHARARRGDPRPHSGGRLGPRGVGRRR